MKPDIKFHVAVKIATQILKECKNERLAKQLCRIRAKELGIPIPMMDYAFYNV